MTFNDFDKLVEYVVTKRIKGVMCQKSAEYARGGDKVYNFKRAAKVSGKTPLECLQGMKLKHDVSILDMLDEVDCTAYSREKWEEKIGDDINYLILMLALLYEKYGWIIPDVETKLECGDDVKRLCTSCVHFSESCNNSPCNTCFGLGEGHPNWEPKK